MNPYAYTDAGVKEIPPYVEKDLAWMMVSGAVAVLLLCISFACLSIMFAVLVQVLILLGYIT